jgi:probable HAF family extracellular repeat protein
MNSLPRFALWLIVLVCVSPLHAQSKPVIPEANLTFTTIDVPGAVATDVLGINSAEDMVGYYTQTSNGPGIGFLLSSGNFTFFSYPGGDSTLAVGINDSGLISGTAYIRQYTAAVGFLYNGTTFSTIRARGETATLVHGINNAGLVVGGKGTLSAITGFELVGRKFHTISPPGTYTSTFGDGINNLDEVVGSTAGGFGSNNGFAYKGGKFKTLTVPGSNDLTVAWGVNDSGIIVGSYGKCSPCAFYGFALMNGKYVSLRFPGAMETFASGINNAGQIVGSYTFDQQTYHGFVTSPITAADFR